jgi:magnesium chelatase family protein
MRTCTCTPQALHRYRGRIPVHLPDRIDMHVEVPAVRYRELADRNPGESSEAMRGVVERAREVQRARFGGHSDVQLNAQLTSRDLREHCAVGEGADAILRTAISRMWLSARAYHHVLRMARTIADLDGGGDITTPHVTEAIQYRSPDLATPPAT